MQAIASSRVLRSRLGNVRANSFDQMRSLAKMLSPTTSGPSSSRISRTISGPASRLSPL